MTEFGMMGVDWEERIDFDRMRRERLAKAKKALEESGLDALFMFSPEDVRYTTGFRFHLGPVPILLIGMVILPKGGDPILSTIDGVHAKARMPWMKKDNIICGPFGPTWGKEVKSKLGKLAEGKVGIDILPKALYDRLLKTFPKAEFVDGKAVIDKAKIIKTKDEIECQKTVTMITEAGFQELLRNLKPGVKECELLGIAWNKFTALGSEWTQCANIVCSGPYTAPYRRLTSDRIIREGDLVVVDIGACFNGYWGDFTRTFVCGDIMPTKEQIALHQEAYDTLFSACADSRAGKTNKDVAKHLNHPKTNPNSFGLSAGHGAGTGPWEHPHLIAGFLDEPITLRPGMLFSIEPYAGKVGIGGVRLENQVIVTDGDPDIITTLPFEERLLKNVHRLDKTTGRRKAYRKL
jgi:Xaa-Pro aminopeptidase